MVQSQIRGGNEIKIRSKDQCRCSDDLNTDQTRWKSSQTYHFDFNSQLGELGLPGTLDSTLRSSQGKYNV